MCITLRKKNNAQILNVISIRGTTYCQKISTISRKFRPVKKNSTLNYSHASLTRLINKGWDSLERPPWRAFLPQAQVLCADSRPESHEQPTNQLARQFSYAELC